MSRDKPILVGITGGIGAGKSTVAKIFSSLEIPVYDADTRARWVQNNDKDLKQSIIDHFGAECYQNDQLNRQYLAGLVFDNPEKLAVLNSLVHPAVARDFESWVTKQSTPYVLKEAALLFETGSYSALDKIIVVSASEAIRTQRVLARDPQRSEEEVANIMARQWPEDEKISKADFVIINDETQLVIPQVLDIHENLLEQING